MSKTELTLNALIDAENRKYWLQSGKMNAALYAAAPELLEACKEALELIEANTEGRVLDTKDLLRAVIAKAERKK